MSAKCAVTEKGSLRERHEAVPLTAGGNALEDTRGKGVLILVAGPSGAGKDSLISAARRALATDRGIAFPLRFITRADQCGEEHIHVSEYDFEKLRRAGLFFLNWDAHGLRYGIPASVAEELEAGHAVVFNISRRMIPRARELWHTVHVIAISVEAGALRERLRKRGRETQTEIEERVRRASEARIEGPCTALDNSGPLDGTIHQFIALLSRSKTGNESKAMAA